MVISRKLVVSLASVCALAAFGQDAEDGEKPAEGLPVAAVKAAPKTPFTILPLCRQVDGEAEVRRPLRSEWETAEEGRYYPLGTAFRTSKDGSMIVDFGGDTKVEIAAGSSFGTRAQALDVPSRTVELINGTVHFKLPDNLPEGALFVSAPGFQVKNPAGESRITYQQVGDGDKAVVRCVTGSLGVEGRHFEIPTMRAANEVVIQTSHDHLSTCLSGTSGDYIVKLDYGVVSTDEIDDEGNRKSVSKPTVSEWHLSPSTRVLINRAVPTIGERMSVHIMAFDAAGERKSECYFCEGRAEVNSGELVAKDKADGDELAKRAAEATETTSEAEEEVTEEESDNNNSESEEE